MYANAKITSKGQITIPAQIRKALGAEKGDTLVFETAAEYVTVRRQPTLQEIVARLGQEYRGSLVPLSDKSDEELIADGIMEEWAEKEKRFGGPFVAWPGGSLVLREGELVPYTSGEDDEEGQ